MIALGYDVYRDGNHAVEYRKRTSDGELIIIAIYKTATRCIVKKYNCDWLQLGYGVTEDAVEPIEHSEFETIRQKIREKGWHK